jgi:sigma-B regulation protein RsbU (phosphoserine phosphatase)
MDSENRPLVLVVDDSPVNRQLLRSILSKEGYRTATAADGAEARKMAGTEQPALILLDIRMPGEDGFDVLKALKTNPETASIPVIFVTGVSDIDAKLSGFDLGAVDYVTKPFHPGEVLARVRLHLKLSIATNSLIISQADKLRQLTDAQAALLPTPTDFPEAKFGVYYSALLEAGGDFFDVLPISPGIFGYCVADFSGHDIKTSYLTAGIKTLLKQNTSPIYQPTETVKMINDVLVEILPEGLYVTACYARLNRPAARITLINAGHPPAIHAPAGRSAAPVDIPGDVLGTFGNVRLGRKQIDVKPGDRFFLYSDGLIESGSSTADRRQRIAQLARICEQTHGIPIENAPQTIVQTLLPDPSEVHDDITLLGLEI